MRSSYGTPSSFSSATSRPFARSTCRLRITSGSSRIDSTTVRASTAYVGDAGSSSSSADSAKSESAWWSEKSHWRSSATTTRYGRSRASPMIRAR